MKFIADENIDKAIVIQLRSDGHEVVYIAEYSAGIKDEDVLSMANKQGMLLLTADKDFGELVFRQKLLSNGIVFIRLSGLTVLQKCSIVSTTINQYQKQLKNAFTVISQRAVRIRHSMP